MSNPVTGGPVKKNASNSTPVTSVPIPSFSSYKKIKEAERRSHFEPKLKKKKLKKRGSTNKCWPHGCRFHWLP